MTPALCPGCRSKLVIGGDGLEGTYFYWGPDCGAPRDPEVASEGQIEASEAGRGTAGLG